MNVRTHICVFGTHYVAFTFPSFSDSMSTTLHLDPKLTALVVIDLQQGIAGRATVPHTAADVIARSARLAEAFRARNGLVILVNVDPGRNGELMPSPTADVPRPPMQVPEEWCELVPELSVQSSDVRITKHQPNAFYMTKLDDTLRAHGIRTIVLCGISTNVGVEATARSAHERRYDTVFAEDAMAAMDEELHRVSTTKFFPTIGRVRSTDEIVAALA